MFATAHAPVFMLPTAAASPTKRISPAFLSKTNTFTVLMLAIATFQETFAITGGSHPRNIAGSTTKLTPGTDCVVELSVKFCNMNNVIENERAAR